LLASGASSGGGITLRPAASRAMRRLLTLTALLTLLAPVAVAHASSGGWQQLLREACRNGQITHHYSQSDYRKALAHIPTDAAEYTDCTDILRQGQLAAAGGGKGGGGGSAGGTGGGGAAPVAPGTDPLAAATPAERKAVHRAVSQGANPVNIAGQIVNPGKVGLAGLTSAHGLPVSLLVALILLALGGLGAGGATAFSRVRARRSR
jgi:hypothetical protein